MINRSFGRRGVPRRSAAHRGIALWHVALTLATLGLLAAIILPVFVSFNTDRAKPPGPSCQSQLKQIMLAMKQYVQDNDSKFPTVEGIAPTYGWADAIQPYLKTSNPFQCPDEISGQFAAGEPTKPGYTDYWYNAQMSGKSRAGISPLTFALGDGNDGKDLTDARYSFKELPDPWRKVGSPMYRHEEGANLAFIDGHVKWFEVKSWKNSVSNGYGTFVPAKK
ncbi:hypothetical protein EON80_02010 [bacterium]|nr:MAG: hypothetical protein EON80_02010 [bacterium]